MSSQGGQANQVLGIWSLLSPQSRLLACHNLAPAHGFRGCRVWLPPGFVPYLTLLDTSGHGQLIILLQQTYLPLHGEDVELRARAWRGGSGTHQIVDRTPQRPPCPFSFINEKTGEIWIENLLYVESSRIEVLLWCSLELKVVARQNTNFKR